MLWERSAAHALFQTKMELSRRGAFSDFLTSSNAPMQNDESRVSLEDLGVGERVASREQLEDLVAVVGPKDTPPFAYL